MNLADKLKQQSIEAKEDKTNVELTEKLEKIFKDINEQIIKEAEKGNFKLEYAVFSDCSQNVKDELIRSGYEVKLARTEFDCTITRLTTESTRCKILYITWSKVSDLSQMLIEDFDKNNE